MIGEPGIGKTRLAEALEQTARTTGALTAWGRFQPAEGAPPLWAFAQVMRELDPNGLAEDILRVLNDKPAPRPVEHGADAHPAWSLSRGMLQDAGDAQALEHFEEAVRQHTEQRYTPWIVRSQLELARLLLRPGKLQDHARAAALLDQALQLAAACGMKPWLENIQRARHMPAEFTADVS